MKPFVTDHAVVRYLERVAGMNLDLVRDTIAATVAPAVRMGARAYSKDGFSYQLDGPTVITVMAGNGHASNPARKAKRPRFSGAAE